MRGNISVRPARPRRVPHQRDGAREPAAADLVGGLSLYTVASIPCVLQVEREVKAGDPGTDDTEGRHGELSFFTARGEPP